MALPTPVPADAGAQLRTWRLAEGASQEAVAHQLGVTVSTVNRWERGHCQPSRLAWRAVLALLGRPCDASS